jgi:hypothetical protein
MTLPPQIAKLVRLLASDKPGEVVAAAQAIRRRLQSLGLDIHALADAVESRLPVPSSSPGPIRTRRRPRGSLLRIGDLLICDEAGGVFRTCRCGSSRFTVAAGAGPHLAQLICDACGARGRWLSRHYFVEAAS